MNTVDHETNAVARAAGAYLKHKGVEVPHSLMLNALTSALGHGSWQHLKAASARQNLKKEKTSQERSCKPLDCLAGLTLRTKTLLRLAFALGTPVSLKGGSEAFVQQEALAVIGNELSGLLQWRGWNVPASLSVSNSSIDAGDFKPENASIALFSFTAKGERLSAEIAYSPVNGWYLSSAGAAQLTSKLGEIVSDEDLLGKVKAPMVTAEFWTDDYVFETSFDATPYFEKASEKELLALMECDFSGDSASDAVAEHAATYTPKLQDAMNYIALHNKGARDSIGFECSVDRKSFLVWMSGRRAALLAKLLCLQNDVVVSKSQDEETEGMWNWRTLSEGSECALPSEEDAYFEACQRLKLLDKAFEN